jgi:hypothetical protein
MLKSSLPLAVAASGVLALTYQTSGQAQQCTPLEVVGSNETSITKTVDVPEGLASLLPGVSTNWDTDWIVPSNANYSQYQAYIVSEDGGTGLDIDFYLKYADQTADRAYSAQSTSLYAGDPLVLEGMARSDSDPYQINLRIGGLEAEGVTYTATVYGCN